MSIITKFFHWDGCSLCPASKALMQGANRGGAFSDYREFESNSNPDAFTEYRVTNVPTVLIFEDGVEVQRYTGPDPIGKFVQLSTESNCVDGVCVLPGSTTTDTSVSNDTAVEVPQTTTTETNTQTNTSMVSGLSSFLIPAAIAAWFIFKK